MGNPRVVIDGREYDLATKLRVAYKVQGLNDHKPYTEIFQHLDSMPIEQQISILYAAFEVANPDSARVITSQKFLDWYLDHYNVGQVMDQLQDVIGGILGKDLKSQSDDSTETSNEGN